MKRTLLSLASAPVLVLGLVACGDSSKTAKEMVDSQLATVYPLTAEERSLAIANAKRYYEQEWPTNNGTKLKGTFINCRPSDSNTNGLVSCTGYIVNTNGQLLEKTVYSGYRPDLVGVSDVDTVNPK